MANPYRIPDPSDDLRRNAPRTGPVGVPNMGGIAGPGVPRPPRGPMQPVVGAKPGPLGAPTPMPPLEIPPMPPGFAARPERQPQQARVAPAPAPPAPAAPAAPAPAAASTAGQSAAAAPPYNVVATRARAPSSDELSALGTGNAFTTPHGDVFRDRDGRLKMNLSEAGKQRWQERRMEALRTFGTYPGMDDPEADPPPVVPGMPMFNPFEARWVGGE